MRFSILTLFPEMFEGPMGGSILGRARDAGLIDVVCINPRDFTTDRHHVVDDTPYGGGSGMVMKPEPLVAAIQSLRAEAPAVTLAMLTPGGARFDQGRAQTLATGDHLALLCGRYEGIDERVMRHVDMELSVGDFVLSGGEPAAWVVIDAVARLIPGVLGNENSAREESFSSGLLEYPHYTRPREFLGEAVPEVLLSGDHGRIARWRRGQSLLRTAQRRPDMFNEVDLSEEDRHLLALAESGDSR